MAPSLQRPGLQFTWRSPFSLQLPQWSPEPEGAAVLEGCSPPVLEAALSGPSVSQLGAGQAWLSARPDRAPLVTQCWWSRAPPFSFPKPDPQGPRPPTSRGKISLSCACLASCDGRAGAPSSQGWPWSTWVPAARDLGTRWAHHRCRSLPRATFPPGRSPWPQTPPWTVIQPQRHTPVHCLSTCLFSRQSPSSCPRWPCPVLPAGNSPEARPPWGWPFLSQPWAPPL